MQLAAGRRAAELRAPMPPWHMVVNLGTQSALGLTVAADVLAAAHKVQ